MGRFETYDAFAERVRECKRGLLDFLVRAKRDGKTIAGYGAAGNYMMRRRWDYFVRWLLDKEPPKGYEIRTGTGRVGGPAQ